MKDSTLSTTWSPFRPMLNLDASDAHVARAVVLPLDCSRKQLKDLLTLSGESEMPFGKRLDEYCVEASKRTGSPDDPLVVEFIHEIARLQSLLLSASNSRIRF